MHHARAAMHVHAMNGPCAHDGGGGADFVNSVTPTAHAGTSDLRQKQYGRRSLSTEGRGELYTYRPITCTSSRIRGCSVARLAPQMASGRWRTRASDWMGTRPCLCSLLTSCFPPFARLWLPAAQLRPRPTTAKQAKA